MTITQTKHTLYRFFGRDSQLLYIGITNNPPNRLAQHRADKDWWTEIVEIKIENYPNRKDLKAAEREAIRAEQPLYNKIHNGKSFSPLTQPIDTAKQNPLKGKFFHTTENCRRHEKRVASWQGHIIDVLAGDLLLIETFEWLMGERKGQEIITLADFVARKPVLYENDEEMRYHWRHGQLRHSYDCEVY